MCMEEEPTTGVVYGGPLCDCDPKKCYSEEHNLVRRSFHTMLYSGAAPLIRTPLTTVKVSFPVRCPDSLVPRLRSVQVKLLRVMIFEPLRLCCMCSEVIICAEETLGVMLVS